MGQCCLGGEKSEEQVNLSAVNDNQKGPAIAAVMPKTSVPSEGDGKPGKSSATAVNGDDLKLAVKSEAIPHKSAVAVVNSKLEQPNVALKKESKEHESLHKMERGPKVKIVVDENRILQYIKEKQSIKDEVAMIGRGKPAQFKSSINSVPPPSSAKSKCPTPFKPVSSQIKHSKSTDIEGKLSSTNEDHLSSLSNPSGVAISSKLSSTGGGSKSSKDDD